MKRYRLIKEYPNSPKLDTILLSSTSEYYSIHPEKYPDFWEKFIPDKNLILGDGLVEEGDTIYYIDTEYKIRALVFLPHYYNPETKYFKFESSAKKHLESLILVNTEDGLIDGKNIKLYALCLNSTIELRETNSLELFIRNSKSNPLSKKWKYFISEGNRNEYIHWNEKIFSRKDIIEMTNDKTILLP